MDNHRTSKPGGKWRRRQYLTGIAGAMSIALAGCSGDTSGSGGTTTQDPCLKDHSQKFCQSEDFVAKVKQYVESREIESTDPPRLFGGGVLKEDGEPQPTQVGVEMVSDAPDQLEGTGEVVDGDSIPEPTRINMGYVVDGFAEYIDDYPHITSMVVPVYNNVDREEYYGKFTILRSYAEKYNNGERSAEWYLNTTLLTWNPA